MIRALRYGAHCRPSNAVQSQLIKSFKYKGLERFLRTGDMRDIQAQHAPRLVRLLDAMDNATDAAELNVPGWFLHRLKGDLKNLWSIRVSGNGRLTFVFQDGDAEIVPGSLSGLERRHALRAERGSMKINIDAIDSLILSNPALIDLLISSK